jgi:hypothetical protein
MGVGFRGNRARRAGVLGEAVTRRPNEGGACRKNGIENEASSQKNQPNIFSSVASKLTWKRSGNQLTALTRPNPTQGEATGLACGMPSSWRGDCSAMGDCATAGASGAISVTVPTRDRTQRHFVEHLFQHRVSRVPCALGINVRRVIHKMCWVRSRKQSGGPGAQLASTVAGDVPPCQPRRAAASIPAPGHFVSRHCRGSAVPFFPSIQRMSGAA